MGVWYCRREQVKTALDAKSTSRDDAQIDREIEAKSRDIESFLHRRFYPVQATRYFDWPNSQMGRSYRLWLDQYELVSADTVTAGGATITDYFLEPANEGPPFDRLEVDLAGQDSFNTGGTHQRDITISGLWAGAAVLERTIGTLAATLAADEQATAQAVWSTAEFGVGDLLRIDDERCIITGRTMVNSTQTLGNDLAASNADNGITVSNGAAFAPDTILLVDTERMLITDVAGDTLVVKRAWDGTPLASHSTGGGIWTLTGVRLDRAVLGTTLAAHAAAAVISQWQVPGPVNALCIAEVLNQFEQERSGYARTIGSGDNVRNATGTGIDDIRKATYRSHGRKARVGAV